MNDAQQNNGYTSIAIAAVVAAVSFYFDVTASASASIPIYASVILVLGGLLATVKAAPIMLSLRRIGDSPVTLQKAFDGFRRWGNVRGDISSTGLFDKYMGVIRPRFRVMADATETEYAEKYYP